MLASVPGDLGFIGITGQAYHWFWAVGYQKNMYGTTMGTVICMLYLMFRWEMALLTQTPGEESAELVN